MLCQLPLPEGPDGRQLLLSGAGVGLAASALLFLGAELIRTRLYTEPALAPLCQGRLLLGNYPPPGDCSTLRPYEARVYLQ